MSLSVTILGCAGSYAAPGNACSGYLVRSPGATVVLDLGPGTLANLQRHVEIAAVDAVVLSHQHPDHWLDLPILRNAMRYYLGLSDLAVYGTAGTREQAQCVIGELDPTLRWSTVGSIAARRAAVGPDTTGFDTDRSARDGGATAAGTAGELGLRIGDQRLTLSVTDHPVETLAVRIDAGERSLAYSADTGPAWSPADIAEGAGLFLCEATITEAHEDHAPHLSGRQAGRLARDAGVGKLLLTHLAPGIDPEPQRAAAAQAFGGPVELAQVGRTYVV